MIAQRIGPRILLSCAAVLASLLVAEVAVRLSGYEPVEHYRSRLGRRLIADPAFAVPYVYEPYACFSEHWPSNPRGYFDPVSNGILYRINNAGFRGEDFEVERDGRFRLALLGDSLCFGNGVKLRHHFATRLEERLSDSGVIGRGVEILNFGLGNYDTAGEVALFRHVVEAYRPDACLILYYPNDLLNLRTRDGRPTSLQSGRALAWLRDRVYVLDRVIHPLEALSQQRRYVAELLRSHEEGASGLPLFRAALREFRSRCEAIGAVPLLAIHPVLLELTPDHPLRPAHARVLEEARAAGMAALDLLPAFVGRRAPDLWVHPLDPHPNEKAHAIASEALFNWFRDLVRRGILAARGEGSR